MASAITNGTWKNKSKTKLFHTPNQNSIFKILVKNNLNPEMIYMVLKHYKIIKKSIEDENTITEEDYNFAY